MRQGADWQISRVWPLYVLRGSALAFRGWVDEIVWLCKVYSLTPRPLAFTVSVNFELSPGPFGGRRVSERADPWP